MRFSELDEINDVFGDPLELARHYVEPQCQEQNPANWDEAGPDPRVKEDASALLQRFFHKPFTSSSGGDNTLVLLSDAGMGKTSFLMMIKLSHLTGFWPSNYRCVLMKLGPSVVDRIRQIENRRDTLLLLDSLDEDPEAWGSALTRLNEIFEETKSFWRVILTCRTQFFPRGESDPFRTSGRIVIGTRRVPVVYLSYFDEERVLTYLKKRFRGSWLGSLFRRNEYRRRMTRALELTRSSETLMLRPLLLSRVDDLLSSETLKTRHDIFEALITTWLLREVEKLGERGQETTHVDLLVACDEVAGLLAQKGGRTLSANEVARLSGSSGLQYVDIGGRSLMNRDSDGRFRFAHYAIQEFMLAKHLVRTHGDDRVVVRDLAVEFLLDEMTYWNERWEHLLSSTGCIRCGAARDVEGSCYAYGMDLTRVLVPDEHRHLLAARQQKNAFSFVTIPNEWSSFRDPESFSFTELDVRRLVGIGASRRFSEFIREYGTGWHARGLCYMRFFARRQVIPNVGRVDRRSLLLAALGSVNALFPQQELQVRSIEARRLARLRVGGLVPAPGRE